MKIRTLIAGYVLALALFLFAQRHPASSSPTEFHAVVDLTHPSAEKSAASAVQVGTRIEAPAYFAAGLWTIEQIPGRRLIAPLVVLDVRANAARQSDYQISVEDIARWELAHNQIPLRLGGNRTHWDGIRGGTRSGIIAMPTGGARCTSQGILPMQQSFWLRDAMSSDLALILWELIMDLRKTSQCGSTRSRTAFINWRT